MIYEFIHPKKHITEVPFYKLLPSDDIDVVEEHLDEFFTTMFERQSIWYKKTILENDRPWTVDPFFAEYKFTNVYRELDRSSQYLIQNILKSETDIYELVFQTMVYRYFNKPDCFKDGHIEMPSYADFNPEKLYQQVLDCREKYYNPWHTAYMSNLVWAKKEPFSRGLLKDLAYCMRLFPIFHENTENIVKMLKDKVTPEKLMKKLEKLPSISGFMSHELFLDFSYFSKYTPHKIHFDENSYTNVGPGASLGIKLIFPSLSPKEQKEAIYTLRDIAEAKLAEIGDFKLIFPYPITLHTIEMWCCEFSKYKKMQWGVGKQRSKYGK